MAKQFKYAVPTECTYIESFAEEHKISDAAARYHLEKMVKEKVLDRSYVYLMIELDYNHPRNANERAQRHVEYTPA